MRHLVLICVLLLLPTAPLFAQGLVSAEQSSLFGYQLGMSLAEAEAVRPFDEVHVPKGSRDDKNFVVGTLHGYDQDGVPLTCSVAFADDRLTRVVASFDVADLASVKWQLEKALGPGVETTRTKQTAEVTIAQTSLTWDTDATQLQLAVFPQVKQTFSLVLQGRGD